MHSSIVMSTDAQLSKLEERGTPVAIVNKQTKLCVTAEMGNDVYFSECHGLASQLWFQELNKDNELVLFNRENGMVLSRKSDKNRDRLEIEIYRQTRNQFFGVEISKKNKKYFTIKNELTDTCIQIRENTDTKGLLSDFDVFKNISKLAKACLHQKKCEKENDAQLFKFQKFDLSKSQKLAVQPIGQILQHESTGLCVTRNKNILKLRECSGLSNQLWMNVKDGNANYISGDYKRYYITSEDNELSISKTKDEFCRFNEIASKKKDGLISLKNISTKTCMGSNEDDPFDIKIDFAECKKESKEQLFKFVDLTTYDYFKNELYKSSKKYPFMLQWVYLKNELTNTCLKFNGENKAVTHEKCEKNEAFQWKIININTKKFLIVTKYEDYVLAPKKHTTNTGMQILAVHFNKDKLKEDEYINLFAISNQYKEFKLLQINDLNCLDFVRTSTAVTTGECFCQKKCQTVSPKILKEKISNLSPPKNPENPPQPKKPTKCTPPMVKEDPLNPFSDCVEKVDPTIEPAKKCTPPMVNADPKDPDSKCVNINALYPPNTPRPNPNSK